MIGKPCSLHLERPLILTKRDSFIYKKLQIIALHYIIILYVFLCYEIVNYMIDIIIYVLIFFFFYSFNKVIQMPSNSGWYLQEG